MFAAPVMLVLAGMIGADTHPVLVIPPESFATLTMTPNTKPERPRAIFKIQIDVPDVVDSSLAQGDPITIRVLFGRKAGKTKVSLTDAVGATETYDVIVAREVGVPLGLPLAWEWPGGKTIKTIGAAAG